MKRKILFLFLLSFSFHAFSEGEKPIGVFQNDSVMIVKPIKYSLMMEYPIEWQVIFPDSSFPFLPFEVLDVEYFQTQSDSSHSFDSTVYTLLSFSLDSIQSLGLPVFVINGQDSFSIPAEPRSVVFQDLIPVVSDSLEVKTNTDANPLKILFDYPRLFWALGTSLAIILAIIVLFGRTIQKAWKVYWLDKRHKKFLEEFQVFESISGLEKEKVEGMDNFWRSYLESISSTRYSALTTKEVSQLSGHQEISVNLKLIDNWLYGNKEIAEWSNLVISLKHFAEDLYHKRREAIKSKKK